jgi:GNAT superfamily N-acetyltransferase
MNIIRATVADVPDIAPLFDAYRQWYGKTGDLAGASVFLHERLLHSESVIFLAFENDQAIGFTQLYPVFSSVSMRREWILNDLFVDATMRNTGAGSALLQAAKDFVIGQNAKGILLETAPDNAHAQYLYEKMNWEKAENFYYYWTA